MSDKMEEKLIAYCGKRMNHLGKLFDTYVLVKESTEDLLFYKTSRRSRFIIGQIYEGKISADHRIDLSSFESTADTVERELLAEWSAEDMTARRALQNESARKKLQKEHQAAWMDSLEPLRRQYRQMSYPQRRAMRQLIVEWLED